ncbi:MAG TPA: response regulator, partial [Opitutaceae bacterium]|nr:response regulator [Opitutaceae bacterium]
MKAKILLVDDEPDALEVLSYSLKAAGCTTLLAQDGARALAIAKAERPDLIVLDL